MVVSNMVRAALVVLIALPCVSRSPLCAYALAFALSVAAQFFGPAETAAIPRLVPKTQLLQANSLFFSTMMLALGFGFALGEPIISRFGMGKAHLAVAGFFLFAATLLLFVPDNKVKQSNRTSWWEDLRLGLTYIFRNKQVLRAIVKTTIVFSTIITLNIIAVALAQQVLHIQPFQFGYIVAAAGLGLMAGNFVVGVMGHKLDPATLSYAGFTSLGLFMSALGALHFIAESLLPALGYPALSFQGLMMSVPLLLSALVGISCALVIIPTQAALQAAVPKDLRGKVFGAQNMAMSATSMIPVVLAGVSADNLPGGVSTTLLALGIPTFLSGLHYLLQKHPV